MVSLKPLKDVYFSCSASISIGLGSTDSEALRVGYLSLNRPAAFRALVGSVRDRLMALGSLGL